ncbi:hypothetical protein ACWOAH_00010 [Vagococcus vulneris]|uniref:Endonuclease/exonuclease/phosphatase domain-containing protein n=1 Tax=Vagococcus vulneris TaxID=1977869 RepID=A0A430A2N9_9ENTE|nr:hypothetical protein [Vagococcus vulneris]RSU00716.1 hypothetical protein CBF37_01520 [Vagococcus vulneris]
MKIVSWNCLGAFRLKRKFIESFEADLYIISEVESVDKLGVDFTDGTVNYQYIIFDDDKKGLLAYSKKHKVQRDDIQDLHMRYFLPVTCNNQKFVGIWTKDYYVSDIYTYCLANDNNLSDRIFIDDFNSSVNFDRNTVRKYRGFSNLNNWFTSKGYISAYHLKENEEYGQESQHTYWTSIKINGEKQKKNRYHIDYCFLDREIPFKFKILNKKQMMQ